ncbi:MAG TPA: ChbG/HpnK family deacetylase [Terriglobales bacterium]|nr:ChbG/HpnK family deacetylase [Terriglobales bacterium]
MRRLIINADDFGLTSGINRGIIEAHQHGIVTSTTLMANGPAFGAAVVKAAALPSLAVGCHVVLLDGKPLVPATEIGSLVMGASNGLNFPNGLAGFAARALAGRINPEQVETEAAAQFRKIQAAGISISHFDSHKHTHMFPAILRPLLKAARACGVSAVRNPFPPLSEMPLAVLLSRARLWKRYAQLKFLRRFASDFQQDVKEAGLFTPDGTIGIAVTGSLDEELFRLIVKSLPEGTWEFVCHPGYHDAELEGMRTRLKASRARELEVLSSPETQDLLARERIQLISFRDVRPPEQKT